MFVREHKESTNLDGANILMLTSLGQVWPHLSTLDEVRDALLELLPSTPFAEPNLERKELQLSAEKQLGERGCWVRNC